MKEASSLQIEIKSERITGKEYIDFLKRTDLGSQYPKERFESRIARLVQNTSISLIAREGGKIVGVCFGITDFAYWLFITDLGVDRDYIRQGIGKQLLQKAMECAGGQEDIILYTCANKNAVPFYEKMGMSFSADVMEYNHTEWTSFTVE